MDIPAMLSPAGQATGRGAPEGADGMTFDHAAVVAAIRQRADKYRLTAVEIAETADMTVDQVRRIRRGETTRPQSRTRRKLSVALGWPERTLDAIGAGTTTVEEAVAMDWTEPQPDSDLTERVTALEQEMREFRQLLESAAELPQDRPRD